MARQGRRACTALFLVLLFAFRTLMYLRTLKAPDGLPALGPALELAPLQRHTAHQYSIQVAFHIQPYKGRDNITVHDNIKYIIDTYGSQGAFYRSKNSMGKSLPLFYIYDSYLTTPKAWAHLLTPNGPHSICSTPYEGVFIALLVEEGHTHDILVAAFAGMHTYFASNGFSFGSSIGTGKL
ncbi:Glycoprotein endo-alpha-1,2-mannosidase-like protein [Heterocephalus glaber]|uniref:Glycoprotein endo-alpha-1,2-mannosidase-like protein n=1 Tax=Heterocephalus glaber TaxID=10181 RepID=G5C4E8_HETGA|nr:Glycoprotein endo-alpha-1,2-mannosidase-like protein [Heterocephalus glaber]